MNLPNKLTLLRICLIPFFLIALLGFRNTSWGVLVAAAIFVLASLTDYLDGQIARKYNLITTFGKFMDPIADKLLVSAALIAFVELGALSAWVVIIIIAREFIISGFRLVAADSGLVLAASMWGKAKTVVQMVMIVYFLLFDTLTASSGNGLFLYVAHVLVNVFVWLTVFLTVVSAADYIIKNRQVLTEKSKGKN